jgi:DNA invertase Pin-like site-specific DNA recombinase
MLKEESKMQRGERVPRAPDVPNQTEPDPPLNRSHRPIYGVDVVALGYVSAPSPAGLFDAELREQAEAIDRFCTEQGWDLVGLVRDLEASRGRFGRPSLNHAIDRLKRRHASCLVVAELRRLCPSVAELGGILAAVENAGARLVSLDPAFDTSTPVGRETMRVLASVSGWERARRARMTSAARANRSIPTIDAKLKRRIARMRGAGMTLQSIADTLNEEEVPTVRGGAKWRPSSVQAALGYKRPRVWS